MSEEKKQPNVEEYLKALKAHTPQRDPEMAARGRAHFLAEAERLRKPQAKPWFAELRDTLASLQIRGNRRLATALASILIALVVTFGAVGGTVYASQDSLPNQTLYAVKTFYEDVRLQFADRPQEKIDLLQSFTNRRVEEVRALSEQDGEIPERTLSRLEQHTETMLQLAAEQDEQGTSRSLAQIQNALQAHQEIINRLANQESGKALDALFMVQEKLEAKIQLAEEGMDNPASFRERMQGQNPFKVTGTEQPGKPQGTGTPQEPGKPEDVGTPEDKGKPEDVGTLEGTPHDPGKPEEVGTPINKGRPEDAVPPQGKEKPDIPGAGRKKGNPKP